MNETEEDLRRERAVMETIIRHITAGGKVVDGEIPIVPKKLPINCRYDFALIGRSGRCLALFEIKTRNRTIGQFQSVGISMQKFVELEKYTPHLRCYLAFSFVDGWIIYDRVDRLELKGNMKVNFINHYTGECQLADGDIMADFSVSSFEHRFLSDD